jgi:hypothetical protein
MYVRMTYVCATMPNGNASSTYAELYVQSVSAPLRALVPPILAVATTPRREADSIADLQRHAERGNANNTER